MPLSPRRAPDLPVPTPAPDPARLRAPAGVHSLRPPPRPLGPCPGLGGDDPASPRVPTPSPAWTRYLRTPHGRNNFLSSATRKSRPPKKIVTPLCIRALPSTRGTPNLSSWLQIILLQSSQFAHNNC